MFPSIATIVFGSVITIALAAIDWYVWRAAPVLPYPLAASRPQFTIADDGEAFKEVA
jgi:hypothetical protein